MGGGGGGGALFVVIAWILHPSYCQNRTPQKRVLGGCTLLSHFKSLLKLKPPPPPLRRHSFPPTASPRNGWRGTLLTLSQSLPLSLSLSLSLPLFLILLMKTQAQPLLRHLSDRRLHTAKEQTISGKELVVAWKCSKIGAWLGLNRAAHPVSWGEIRSSCKSS